LIERSNAEWRPVLSEAMALAQKFDIVIDHYGLEEDEVYEAAE
jgi:hypothetical protein